MDASSKGRKGTGRGRLGAHDRALGLLAVRARSRRELESRLTQAGFESGEIEEVIDRLAAAGLVDDEAFAREFATHAFGVRGNAERSVRGALRSKGVSPQTVEAVIADTSGAEEERASLVARARATRLQGLDAGVAYRRLVDFMLRRGYGYELAAEAARDALEVDPEGAGG